MTIQEFRSSETLVAVFGEILKTPEVQLAIATIKDAYLPISSEPTKEVSFEVWNSHQNTRREGFYEAIRLIELMAKPISKKKEISTRGLMPSLVNEDTYEPEN
jgi:hypothetical protein